VVELRRHGMAPAAAEGGAEEEDAVDQGLYGSAAATQASGGSGESLLRVQ
jgi:hypothetical protein